MAPAFLLAVPYIAGIAAARRLEARRASFIGIAEVFLAVLYAWPLLGQLPSAVQFTGGAFMLASVVLVHVDENQQRRANPLGRTPRRPSLPWSCRHRDARRARGRRRHDLPADRPVARLARRLGSLPCHQRPASTASRRS